MQYSPMIFRFFLVVTFSSLPSLAADVSRSDPAAVSQRWLSYVDEGDYGSSWTEASALFQQRIPRSKWVEAMTLTREPMGAVSARKVATVTNTTSMPGLPDGDYAIVQFETSFANKASAVETVTLIGDGGGMKVGGYFIK